MAPADLFQWLSLGQKTGTLVVTGKDVEKKIFFRNGRILSSASTDPREYLGQFLMSHGYISEEELKKAMEVQSQSKILLGKILVMINAISEPDLVRLMRLKAEEEIYDIFLWKEGDFHFVDDELPKMELIPLQVDVTGIILEGTRRVDEWSRIRATIPSNDLVPVIEKPADEDELSEVEKRIVKAINGKRTIEELVLETRSSPFMVAQTVTHLFHEGAVRFTQRVAPEAPAAVVEVVPPAAEKEQSEENEVAAMLSRAQAALRTGDYDKTLRLLKAAQSLDPNNPTVRSALKGAETVIAGEVKRLGIVESKVPKIAKTFEEISTMNFTPNEGFLLSRINGQWDVGSIMKVSPMREIDALLIFHRLFKDGIIQF